MLPRFCPRQTVVLLLTAAAALATAPRAQAQRSVAKEQALIQATNEYRRTRGLPALTPSPRLTAAALKHAQNMAEQDNLSHVLNGRGVVERLAAEGYAFRYYAENIGYRHGFANPEADQLRGWQQSAGHNANLLHANVTEIGVGAFRNAQGKWYFCQVFGQPQGNGTGGGASP